MIVDDVWYWQAPYKTFLKKPQKVPSCGFFRPDCRSNTGWCLYIWVVVHNLAPVYKSWKWCCCLKLEDEVWSYNGYCWLFYATALNEIADDVRIDKWLSTTCPQLCSCPQLSSVGVSSGQIITAAGLMLLLMHFGQALIPPSRSTKLVPSDRLL